MASANDMLDLAFFNLIWRKSMVFCTRFFGARPDETLQRAFLSLKLL